MKHKNNKTKNKFKYKPKRGGNPQSTGQSNSYPVPYINPPMPTPAPAPVSPIAGGGENPLPPIKLKSNIPLVAKISSYITIISGMSFLIFLLVWYMLFTLLFSLINKIIKVINKAIGKIIKAFMPGSKAKPPKIPLGPKNLFDLLLNNVGPLPAIY